MELPILPAEQWKAATPRLTCKPDCRSAGHYLGVVMQFPLTSGRYLPSPGVTWCNVYAWDVMSAMGATFPHWVDEHGQPERPGPDAYELSINAGIRWLEEHGPEYGWREVSELDARAQALLGHPALATWSNPRGHGHVAVVLPFLQPTHIAQAGARNFFDEPLAHGFGSHGPIRFWTAP